MVGRNTRATRLPLGSHLKRSINIVRLWILLLLFVESSDVLDYEGCRLDSPYDRSRAV